MSRRVLVTGGASGLGKAIALRFAREGHRVCIMDLNDERGAETQAQLKSKMAECFYFHASVTEQRDWDALSAVLQERWGGVDVLVNNAGIAGAVGGIDEIAMEEWNRILDINLLAVVRGCRTFFPLFRQQGNGYLINIASAAGLMNAPMMSAYNVAKAGVISLSESLRIEMDTFGGGVSVVCPAFFQTNLVESLVTENKQAKVFLEKLMAASNITADDIAEMIYRGFEKNQFMILPHRDIQANWLMKRVCPSFFHRLLKMKTRSFLAMGNKQSKVGDSA